MDPDPGRLSPDEARSRLASSATTARPSRQDRAQVAAGIAGSDVVLGIYLVWLPPWVFAGGTRQVVALAFFGVGLVGFNYVRTHVRTTPRDTQRLAVLSAVLTFPAVGAGMLVAHAPWGPALPWQLAGALVIALPGLLVGHRILVGSE